MPAIVTAPGSQKAKPTTRSSIRHTLGFASVGRALADVMNKEGKDGDKNAKKSLKESRRLSAVNMPVSSFRTANSSSPGPKVSDTPDSKTITRRRASVASALQKPRDVTMAQSTVVTRSTSLRPRPTTSSGLPKYRPKSVTLDVGAKKAPSPVNPSRKRPSTSDKEEDLTTSDDTKKVAQKVSRPISPLPQRAALKANMSRTANVTPPATPTKLRQTPPLKTSARPNKIIKVAPAAAPSSSSSSTNSLVPRTPQTPKPSTSKLSSANKAHHSSSSRNSPHRSLNESPLARHSRQNSKANPPMPPHAGNMSHISEGGSDDGDEEDVELLLAPVAVIDAPTPAMPRILASRQRQAPETPSRSTFLPSLSDLSYASPQPPSNDSPASLRPQPISRGAPRGSILSWEQLADEASRTLGEDEIQNMISDVPAPFRSGTASPVSSTMHLELPESPCLSAMNSPGGYGSISQVLLPEVTPSPALHTRRQSRGPSEVPVIDGAIVTLLRLQLESSEHIAKERRIQLQSLEEELHHVKDAHVHDVEQLALQVKHLEDQLRSSLEVRERSAIEQAMNIADLKSQLKKAHSSGGHNTTSRVQVAVEDSQNMILRSERLKWARSSSAHVAAMRWTSVREFAEMELDVVKSDQEVLLLLLGELDLIHKQLAVSV
ncbi:uncharacterized protein BT62DRAFT_942857 [Guyanagaster necrorhizus]|uniref:Uncharacterized protein n=1 Tax=Guyanagaster necrorhizus TaxID=856835 RepID=A0A9P7VYX0_9AGAR|nr:uncharacterized protein BT62DRAFT_942857 [Guyanagaster necrorhizus MCA 3950]KAG7450151.1 hypothetical protein BT62DRAFT_942857 [Guyanagaster necrorhizus MCA 3950]